MLFGAMPDGFIYDVAPELEPSTVSLEAHARVPPDVDIEPVPLFRTGASWCAQVKALSERSGCDVIVVGIAGSSWLGRRLDLGLVAALERRAATPVIRIDAGRRSARVYAGVGLVADHGAPHASDGPAPAHPRA